MENNSIHNIKEMNKDTGSLFKYDLLLTAIPALLLTMFLIGYTSPIPIEIGIMAASILSSGLIFFGIIDIVPEDKSLGNKQS
ncbi:hypothetical protein [Methanonatronarchaeum sp. AMET-Sl]|uniref:hypothetical protein n=1 Tax=Methanonatronarchaeum sp. AMET-Sl TaxID=3037654 RepID=UPI00244DE019|nr:hypothetical protein [Methanonatronarchaeum sp. AMET-Sl]WGI17440.1 hypothetical protein QEN48_00090 [Methanonatronarchaeum sp. AMET-Sl]